MVEGGLLKKDWFFALVFSLLFLIGVVNGAAFLERFEYIAYDVGIQYAHRNPAPDLLVSRFRSSFEPPH